MSQPRIDRSNLEPRPERAFPLWGQAQLCRLDALRERARVRVSLDSVDPEGLGKVGRESGRRSRSSSRSTQGAASAGPPGRPTVDLVRQVAGIPGIEVIGLLTHGGQAYRSRSSEELEAIARREGTDLVDSAELCHATGSRVTPVDGGCTPPGFSGRFGLLFSRVGAITFFYRMP